DETADPELAARRAHHHLAAGDQRSERDVIGSLAIGNLAGPDFLAGSGVECDQHGLARGEVYLVAIESDATTGIVSNDSAGRTRSLVSPQLVSRTDIDGDHLVV